MKQKIVTTNEDIQLSIVHPVFKTLRVKMKDEEGNIQYAEKEKLVKQLAVRKWFKKDGLTSVEQYVTTNNRIAKNRSVVYDRYSNRYFATFHSPDELWGYINEKKQKPIGFTRA
jgi:hypothetical protein